jgi:uncharacterized protein YbaR (Trm112 family)
MLSPDPGPERVVLHGPTSEECVSVDPRLLEMLVCPACRGGIEPVRDATGLECRECGRIYPVRDGIPVMLVDEATPPKPGAPGD